MSIALSPVRVNGVAAAFPLRLRGRCILLRSSRLIFGRCRPRLAIRP